MDNDILVFIVRDEKDRIVAVLKLSDFDEDFIEYLNEEGHEVLSADELAIEFDIWLKEEAEGCNCEGCDC